MLFILTIIIYIVNNVLIPNISLYWILQNLDHPFSYPLLFIIFEVNIFHIVNFILMNNNDNDNNDDKMSHVLCNICSIHVPILIAFIIYTSYLLLSVNLLSSDIMTIFLMLSISSHIFTLLLLCYFLCI